jgi:two-component system sensor histidine kinase UhpB
MEPGPAGRHPVGMPLFWRVVVINACVVLACVLVLALSPATISSSLRAAEATGLGIGALVVIAVNVILLRRVFRPLERLAALMRRVDPAEPGRRIELENPGPEVADLAAAFNEMLDRLEHERKESGKRSLAAQERERQRLAVELHDELGQTLTGVVLQLEALAKSAPQELHDDIVEIQETAREGVEEVREIARGLRPQALEEFGLRSALATLATGITERTGIRVRHRTPRALPPLSPEQDLAIYRVAQESLTNAARHSGADNVELDLSADDGAVVLRVADDGCGIDESADIEERGLAGMRERALLVGGTLRVGRAQPSGTEVVLTVPIGA